MPETNKIAPPLKELCNEIYQNSNSESINGIKACIKKAQMEKLQLQKMLENACPHRNPFTKTEWFARGSIPITFLMKKDSLPSKPFPVDYY